MDHMRPGTDPAPDSHGRADDSPHTTARDSPLERDLTAAVEAVREVREGEPSDYMKDVPRRPTDEITAAVCTTQGQIVSVGDHAQEFALQSVSKALAYAVALQEVGLDAILPHVGVEPSGEAFNHLSLHDDGRPFNPLINAGAIAVHALLPGDGAQERTERLLGWFGRLAGAELRVSEEVLKAERKRADRNFGLAHLLADAGTLAIPAREAVEGYLVQCSICTTTEQLAVIGATLAAGGVNPVTGERVLDEAVAQQTMTVMLMCGMYDSSGHWAAEVGIPAKSGVSGAVLGAVPGALGLATWSPRLDPRGHSVRGIGVFERLSPRWDLHVLRYRAPLAGLHRAF